MRYVLFIAAILWVTWGCALKPDTEGGKQFSDTTTKDAGADADVDTTDTSAPRGTFQIIADPSSQRIVVAGSDTVQSLTPLRAIATHESGTMDRINMCLHGDSVSYAAVGVLVDGAVRGWAEPPAGMNQCVDVPLTRPIVVPRDSVVPFQFVARLNHVVAPSTIPPSVSAPLSGAVVALSLNAGLTSGEWTNPGYTTSYAVHTIGEAGQLLFAAGTGPLMGAQHVVRNSRLVVELHPQSENELTAGRHALIRSDMHAEGNSTAGVKKVGFSIRVIRSAGSTLQIGNLRLQGNGTDLPTSAYRLVRLVGGADLSTTLINLRDDSVDVACVFPFVEVVTGTPHTYALTAEVLNPQIGDSIETSLINRNRGNITGTLTADDYRLPVEEGGHMGPFILPPYRGAGPMDIGARVTGDVFIWTDGSEAPLADALTWIGDPFTVPTGSQTIRRTH